MKQPSPDVAPSVTRHPSLIQSLPLQPAPPSILLAAGVSPLLKEPPVKLIGEPTEEPLSIHLHSGIGRNVLVPHQPQRQASGNYY